MGVQVTLLLMYQTQKVSSCKNPFMHGLNKSEKVFIFAGDVSKHTRQLEFNVLTSQLGAGMTNA